MQDNKSIIEYVTNTWNIFPIYQFYELEIPNITNKIVIYSTLSLNDVEIKQDYASKFFNIYGVYPAVNRCVGNVFVWRNNSISRVSAHSISACTENATRQYIEDSYRKCEFKNEFLHLFSYGIEAEIITDLANVLQVYVGEDNVESR